MVQKIRLFIKIGVLVILVGSFVFYAIYQAQDFIIGPRITIDYPEDGESLSKSFITVKGQAKNISLLSLNGRQIFTDENGYFNENLLLALGYNIIEVSAQDKFGRNAKEIKEVVVK